MWSKPLHIALVVKNTPSTLERDQRNMGMFSYDVPEFTWTHLTPGKGYTLDTRDLQRQGFDAVFVEDGGVWGDFRGGALPVIYYAIDSTLSQEFHFKPRFEQARKADLVLVDHDRLERFEGTGRPVRRLLYCVNDHLFYPREKTIDVNFQCGGSPERTRLRAQLSEFCAKHGLSYRSGTSPLVEYAENMGHSRVVVVLPRTPSNRPHRIYDAAACGAAVLAALTSRLDESLDFYTQKRGVYRFGTDAELEQLIVELNPNPMWEEPAHTEVVEHHTWRVRAAELREIIRCELSV